MKTVLFLATHKFVLRLFVFGDNSVVNLLIKRNNRVVLICTDNLKQLITDYYQNIPEGLVLESIEKENIVLNKKQKVFLGICRYQIFSGSTIISSSHGARVDYRLSFFRRKILFSIKRLIYFSSKNIVWVRNWFLPNFFIRVFKNREYEDIVEKYKPDLVFLPSAASFTKDQTLLAVTKKYKIKSVGMPGSWDHFGRQYMPLKLDKLLVWGEQLKSEAVKMQHYKSGEIVVTGAPHFDQYVDKKNLLTRKDFFQTIGFPEDTKLIFFGTGGSYYKDSFDIIDMMVKWIDEDVFGEKVALIIRPYPGVEHEQGKFEVFRNHPKVHFFEGNNWTTWKGFKTFINFLYLSDMIVSIYSSISLEGAVMNKPLININFDGYQERSSEESVKRFENLTHFGYLTKTDGIKNVNSVNEFKESIVDYLSYPEKDKTARENLRKSMCFELDGRATVRIVANILK